MFDRGYIKDLARRRLGYGGQGSAIAVLLIAMLLGAVDGAVKLRIHYRVEDNTVELGGMLLHWLSVLMPLFITLSALALLLGILISNVLRVGVRGWFLRYWRGDEPPGGGDVRRLPLLRKRSGPPCCCGTYSSFYGRCCSSFPALS